MPIYELGPYIQFPPVSEAEDGVLAVGGDLSPERLMAAYRQGIFPWYNPGDPIIWWSPDPRCVLFPEDLHISRSMQRLLRRNLFQVTYNHAFDQVIHHCQQTFRPGQEGTWITDEMKDAFIRLNRLGLASSIEVWRESRLVGGMYGVDLGHVFSGESMFSLVSNASKIALILFMRDFAKKGGILLDCQVYSPHLARMGATEISRDAFIDYLDFS
jgi:leucyl/phenylalanyl-tRNA--protein transferase